MSEWFNMAMPEDIQKQRKKKKAKRKAARRSRRINRQFAKRYNRFAFFPAHFRLIRRAGEGRRKPESQKAQIGSGKKAPNALRAGGGKRYLSR